MKWIILSFQPPKTILVAHKNTKVNSTFLQDKKERKRKKKREHDPLD